MRLELFLKLFWMVVLAWNVSVALFALVMRLGGRFWQNNTSTFLRGKSYLCALYLPFSVLMGLVALLLLFAPGVYEAMPKLRLPSAGTSAIPALRAFDWEAAVAMLWAAGALVSAVVRIAPRLRFRRWLKKNRRPLGERAALILENAELQMEAAASLRRNEMLDERPRHRVRLNRKIPVYTNNEAYVADGLSGPMAVMSGCAGGKCLLLDKEDYDDETLDAIFRHELAHIHSGGAMLWGYEDLLAVFGWFNPGAWLLRRCLREEIELVCDDCATFRRGGERRAAYARALTNLAARKRAFLPGTAQMACGSGLLRRRVRALIDPPPKRRSRPVGVLLFTAAMLCVLASGVFMPLETVRVTEDTLLSFLRAPEYGYMGARDFDLGPGGAYGATDANHCYMGFSRWGLSLTYTGEETLSEGQIRLAAALTERLGAPVTSGESGTVWQAVDESGARTEVWLMRGDGLTLTIF